MRMRSLGALVGASVVLACGGGGGGGGGGIGVTWTPASVTASYNIVDADVQFPISARLSSVPTDAKQVALVDSGSVFNDQTLTATSSDGGFTWSATLYPSTKLTSRTTPYTGTLTLHVKKADGTEIPIDGASLSYSLTVMDASTDPGCKQGLFVRRGPYAIENNVEANKQDANPYTGNFTQCTYIAPGTTQGVDARFTWNWPLTSNTLRGFPEVWYGQKPWFDAVSGSDLPAKVSSLASVKAHLDATAVRRSSDFKGNLGFDMWFVSSLQKDSRTGGMPIVGQLQVFPQSTYLQGCNARTFTNGGVTWKVCTWPGSDVTGSWTITIYAAPSVDPGKDIDLVPFIQDYRDHEGAAVSNDDYFPSVELGNQVLQGSGETSVTDFAVTVVKK